MTSINETDPKIAAVSVVLQPTGRGNPISLIDWLSELEFPPIWIPLAKSNGVTKVMAVLSNCDRYSSIMENVFHQISHKTVVEWRQNRYELTGIEVDSNELHLLEIPIYPTAPLPPTLGRAIHAQCFHWLGIADPALAERLHESENFPITLAIKPGSSRNEMCLIIGLLQRELLAPLLWGMSHDLGEEITFTGVPCQLGKLVEFKRSNSFEALLNAKQQKQIELEFVSPTSFKQGQTIQPFPLPELVFSNLWRRWNMFAPNEFQLDAIEWHGFTAAYELKTQALKMKGGAEIGCKGWVRYEFPNPEQAKIATTLAHFATFSGVGRKTAMGMGKTRFGNRE